MLRSEPICSHCVNIPVLYFTGIFRLHLHTRATDKSDHRWQCDQLRGNKYDLQHIVLLPMALHYSSVLQHVHNFSLYDARAFSDASGRSR